MGLGARWPFCVGKIHQEKMHNPVTFVSPLAFFLGTSPLLRASSYPWKLTIPFGYSSTDTKMSDCNECCWSGEDNSQLNKRRREGCDSCAVLLLYGGIKEEDKEREGQLVLYF